MDNIIEKLQGISNCQLDDIDKLEGLRQLESLVKETLNEIRERTKELETHGNLYIDPKKRSWQTWPSEQKTLVLL